MPIDYKKELETASKTMILVHNPNTLIKMIVRMIVQKVKVSHASILLHDKTRNSYILTVSRGIVGLKVPEGFTRMDADNPFIKFFKERYDKKVLTNTNEVLVYDEALKKIGHITDPLTKELLSQTLYQMEIFETIAAIPSYFRDELLGVLLLGKKINDEKVAEEEFSFLVALAHDVAMAIRNAQLFDELERELQKNKKLFFHTTIALAAAIDAKDHYTHGHTNRVTNVSLELARRFLHKYHRQHEQKFLEDVQIASLLHDIGKIGIPENILNKEAPLTPEELIIIKEHPTIGETILNPIQELGECILGVKHHHERYDGTGYPNGLKGEQIPLIAAIICVADAYDAMVSDRPYRKGLGREKAIEEIISLGGSQFHPELSTIMYELYQEGKL